MKKTLNICVVLLTVLSSFLSSCRKDGVSQIRYESRYVFDFSLGGTDTLDKEKAPLLTKLADTVRVLTVQAQEKVYGRKAPSKTPFAHKQIYVGFGQSQVEAEADARAEAEADCESMTKTAESEFNSMIQELEKIRGEYDAQIKTYSKKYKIDYEFSFVVTHLGEELVSKKLGTFRAAGSAELPQE